MTKLFPGKTNSRLLVIYCSVVPHNFPPHHRLEFVKQLSRHLNVIFFDLPSNFRRSSLLGIVGFYGFLVRTFVRFNYSFVWEYFPVKRINSLTLLIYLLLQKLLLKKKIILFTTSAYFDSIYSMIPYDVSIFDCPDRHAGEFEKNKDWVEGFDLVFTNTNLLSKTLKEYNNNVRLIPSGYAPAREAVYFHQKIPDSVLFLGGISQRIDYDLLNKVIRALPDVHFYFMGEIYLNKYYAERKDKVRLRKWQKILSNPNIHYLENLSTNLFKLAPLFRVGIIPYLKNDVFNNNSNPIKLYEYLANGMYIVSTALVNVSNVSKGLPIYTATSAREFADKIRLLLLKPEKDISRYKVRVDKLLRDQSMEKKTRIVLREIKLVS